MGVSLHEKVRREIIEANAHRLRVNSRSFTEARSRHTLRLADNWVSLSSELEQLGTLYHIFKNPIHVNH